LEQRFLKLIQIELFLASDLSREFKKAMKIFLPPLYEVKLVSATLSAKKNISYLTNRAWDKAKFFAGPIWAIKYVDPFFLV
jgi:hypothetical protein